MQLREHITSQVDVEYAFGARDAPFELTIAAGRLERIEPEQSRLSGIADAQHTLAARSEDAGRIGSGREGELRGREAGRIGGGRQFEVERLGRGAEGKADGADGRNPRDPVCRPPVAQSHVPKLLRKGVGEEVGTHEGVGRHLARPSVEALGSEASPLVSPAERGFERGARVGEDELVVLDSDDAVAEPLLGPEQSRAGRCTGRLEVIGNVEGEPQETLAILHLERDHERGRVGERGDAHHEPVSKKRAHVAIPVDPEFGLHGRSRFRFEPPLPEADSPKLPVQFGELLAVEVGRDRGDERRVARKVSQRIADGFASATAADRQRRDAKRRPPE